MKANNNQNKKILVVDDDPVNREFFTLMLPKLGFAVEGAADGLLALESLKTSKPDLILLDNIMPKMTGWELTKLLKEDRNFRDIPIIMFSALDDVKDKLAGFNLGIDDYITKPFNFSEVLARINAILRNSELFAQIKARELRLNFYDDMILQLKKDLSGLQENLNSAKNENSKKQIDEINSFFDKKSVELEELKKGEIELAELENQVWGFLHNE